jgi:hypothetical protein
LCFYNTTNNDLSPSPSPPQGGADTEDTAHVHMDNALRALAGYSGFDGNLANRWPAADADFVIINDEEDDDDDDDDYPYDWNPARQGANDFSQAPKHASAQDPGMRYGWDGAVTGEEGEEDSGSDDGPDSDDAGAGGWTNVGGGKDGEDVFGPSSGGDMFASEGDGGASNDFFASSPSSSSSGGGSPAPSPGPGADFFADFGSPAAASPASEGDDFFATAAGSTSTSNEKGGSIGSDFFGDSSNAFSFSSQPAPVGSVVQPSPTPDESEAPKGITIIRLLLSFISAFSHLIYFY